MICVFWFAATGYPSQSHAGMVPKYMWLISHIMGNHAVWKSIRINHMKMIQIHIILWIILPCLFVIVIIIHPIIRIKIHTNQIIPESYLNHFISNHIILIQRLCSGLGGLYFWSGSLVLDSGYSLVVDLFNVNVTWGKTSLRTDSSHTTSKCYSWSFRAEAMGVASCESGHGCIACHHQPPKLAKLLIRFLRDKYWHTICISYQSYHIIIESYHWIVMG